MMTGSSTFGLAYLAGLFSTLSPCVLPLIPIILGSALSAHRFGAVALTVGLALSFTAIGILLGTLGAVLGIDPSTFSVIGAILLIAAGIVLVTPPLQRRFAAATSGASNAGNHFLSRITISGLPGQFVIGLVLGLVWSPCVGPTLGAALTLAAQGKELVQVSLVMALFGLGAGTPLLILSLLSRSMMIRIRGRLMTFATRGKIVLGIVLILLGIMTLTGFDKMLETLFVQNAPEWLIDLTTRF